MKKKVKNVSVYRSSERRSRIILDISKSIDGVLKNYKEPVRKGTAKGKPIGFSLKKMKAAWWMILHPYCLTLKEIAKRSGVSEGVLRVWCHREDFVQKWQEISHEYGEWIVTKIEGAIYEELIKELRAIPKTEDKWLQRQTDKGILLLNSQVTPKITEELQAKGKEIIEIDDSPGRWSKEYAVEDGDTIHASMEYLPWFNDEVRTPIIRMLEKNGHIPNFLFAQYTLAETLYYWEASPYRVRMRQIKLLPTTKMAFENAIDMLTDPQGRKKLGGETYTEMATVLKKAINNVLDVLAS